MTSGIESLYGHFLPFWWFLDVLFYCYCKIATPASEIDGEGTRVDLEASAVPMDTDVTATTPIADENQKQSSDTDVGQEAGQSEADAEAEAGMIDGETDAEVDLDAVG